MTNETVAKVSYFVTAVSWQNISILSIHRTCVLFVVQSLNRCKHRLQALTGVSSLVYKVWW